MMSLENYTTARQHWQEWADNSELSDAERKKYSLPDAPQESAFLKTKFELLGDALNGLMTQQDAAVQYRKSLEKPQLRDAIQYEARNKVTFSYKTGLNYIMTEERLRIQNAALNLDTKMRNITAKINKDETDAMKLLDEDSIKKEIQRKEEEKKSTANKDAVAAIEKEIAELNDFLAKLPQMREAIQEFSEQQLRQRLSASQTARAALEDPIKLGSSDGVINEGKVLTEQDKKESETTRVRVPGRFVSGSLDLTVKTSYDSQGKKVLDFSIPAQCFKLNRYGLPGYGYLGPRGQKDLAKSIHEKLISAMREEFTIDFSAIDMENIPWFMQYLAISMRVSRESVPPQSAHVILHNASIASLDKWLERNPLHAWWYRKEVMTLKRLNNECNVIKARRLIAETRKARAEAKIDNPTDSIVVTTKMTAALQILTRAAQNELALALDEIDLTGYDVDKIATSLVSLRSTHAQIQTEYEKALAGYEQAQIKLDALPPGLKTKEQEDLEVQVKQLQSDLEELKKSLEKISALVQFMSNEFISDAATQGQIRATAVFQDKDVALNAIAPVVAEDHQSALAIATIIVDADGVTRTDEERENEITRVRLEVTRDPVTKINEAFRVNVNDTMAVLNAAYELVKDPATRTPERIAAMIVNSGSLDEANSVVAAGRPSAATELARDVAGYSAAAHRVVAANLASKTAAANVLLGHQAQAQALIESGVNARDAAVNLLMMPAHRVAAQQVVAVNDATRAAAAGILGTTDRNFHAQTLVAQNVATRTAAADILLIDENRAQAQSLVTHDAGAQAAAANILLTVPNQIFAQALVGYNDGTREAAAKILIIPENNLHANLLITQNEETRAAAAGVLSGNQNQFHAQRLIRQSSLSRATAAGIIMREEHRAHARTLVAQNGETRDIAAECINQNENSATAILAQSPDSVATILARMKMLSANNPATNVDRRILEDTRAEVDRDLNAAVRKIMEDRRPDILKFRKAAIKKYIQNNQPTFYEHITDDVVRRNIVEAVLQSRNAFAGIPEGELRRRVIMAVLETPNAFNVIDNPATRRAVIMSVLQTPNAFNAITDDNLRRTIIMTALATPNAFNAINDDAVRRQVIVAALSTPEAFNAINDADVRRQVIMAALAIPDAFNAINDDAVCRSVIAAALATAGAFNAINDDAVRREVIIAALSTPEAFNAINDEAVRCQVLEAALQDPVIFNVVNDPIIRQAVLTAVIRANPQSADIKTVIDRMLDFANPEGIGANDSIAALAPLLLVAGNEEAKTLLANILVDARVDPPVDDAHRAAAIAQELNNIEAGSITEIRNALVHNRAATLSVLRMMHNQLTSPQANPAHLANLVNTLGIPNVRNGLKKLANPAYADIDNPAAVTDVEIEQARANNPTAFNAIMNNALSIANPTRIAEALKSNPDLQADSTRRARKSADAIRKCRADIKVDAGAKRLKEVQAQANSSMALMNPQATIASRKMAIGALTRIINAGGGARQELARVAVIQRMDLNVLAELIVAERDVALKQAFANQIPNPPAPAPTVDANADAAAKLAMLNDLDQTKAALQAIFINQPPVIETQRAAGNAICNIFARINEPDRHVVMERALGADPVGIFYDLRAGHPPQVTPAIRAEVDALSPVDIREIAKVDRAVAALMVANRDRARPDPLLNLAKCVLLNPGENIETILTALRDQAQVVGMLDRAFAENPIQAQAALNRIIDAVADTQLTAPNPPVVPAFLASIRDAIERNPLAAIDHHPVVRQAIESARRRGVPEADINNDPAVEKARAEVMEGAQQTFVQGKLFAHLLEGKAFTGQPALGVVNTIAFRPEGLADTEPPVVVSADEARDTVLQLMQSQIAYLTDLANDQDKVLTLAEKTKKKTARADTSLHPGIAAQRDLTEVLKALEGVNLMPQDKIKVKQAEDLLSALNTNTHPIGRLFDESVEVEANNAVTQTRDEVTRLEKGLTVYRAEVLAREVAAAAANIPPGLITPEVIFARRVPENGVGTHVQKARAQDYIDLINADKKINDIRLAGGADMEAAILAEIPNAKTRILQDELNEARADVLGALDDQNVRPLFQEAARIGAQNESANVTQDRALAILQAIASGNPTPRGFALPAGITPVLAKVEAVRLLTLIDQNIKVYEKLNKTLDTQAHSKAAWARVVENDPQVQARVGGVERAKEKAKEAVTHHAKIQTQRRTQKQKARDLGAEIKEVQETNQNKKTEYKKALNERKDRAEQLRREEGANHEMPSDGLRRALR